MILAAGLLVLLGLGLFVGGVLTGTTAFYWGCVAVCLVAAVLLYLARRRISQAEAAAAAPAATPTSEPPASEESEPRDPAHGSPPSTGPAAGSVATDHSGDPPIEDVEVTDLLLVVDLTDEVLVVDEHPRYHLAGCRHLRGRTAIPLPLDEARTDGFTPCALCAPDRHLADRERARKAARG